ncbi:hypothetical protein HMPREF0322_02704 [Desulfitobacterium hafniense DP7]|uniref:Uncharacterized protein n=1 Tax=Desulfitobacterium hafniense DP7 TaxID=537010 RepID=G9XP09_DESHA|nr:hypothetical protein HMPREF0322_02704 [Desulfitobacterium hafniense DP7]
MIPAGLRWIKSRNPVHRSQIDSFFRRIYYVIIKCCSALWSAQ